MIVASMWSHKTNPVVGIVGIGFAIAKLGVTCSATLADLRLATDRANTPFFQSVAIAS